MNSRQGELRRGLAVVRCGDSSLHRAWAGECRAFDVAVSYFGNDDAASFPEARYVHRMKAGKWDGIAGFFASFPALVDEYDYFWFPDDDLALDAATADALLQVGIDRNLDLWQPALDRRSYYSHPITCRVEGVALRYTNFVEIMTPVLSARLLRETLGLFVRSRSGFGLDYLWPQLVQNMRGGANDGCAIVDDLPITHTRPVGTVLSGAMATAGGASADEEMAKALDQVKGGVWYIRSVGFAVPRYRNYCGVAVDGRRLRSIDLLARSFRALIVNRSRMIRPGNRFKTLRYLATSFV